MLQAQAIPNSKTIPDRWVGAFYKAISLLGFSLINGMVRYLTKGVPDLNIPPLPYYQIAFLQNFFASIILIGWFSYRSELKLLKTTLPWLHFGYIMFGAIGLIFWYAALAYLPLAICVSLGFLGPIFTIISCRIFLHEKITHIRLMAIIVGLVGAFLITRPDRAFFYGDGLAASLGVYIALPLLSSLSWVVNKTFGRIMGKKGESSKTMALYLLLFMSPILFIFSMQNWVLPNNGQLIWVLLIAIASSVSHIALAKSFVLAEVSFLMPIGFLKLLASGLIGYLAFDETIKGIGVWVGMGTILLSLVLLSCDNKQTKISL